MPDLQALVSNGRERILTSLMLRHRMIDHFPLARGHMSFLHIDQNRLEVFDYMDHAVTAGVEAGVEGPVESRESQTSYGLVFCVRE